MEIRFKLNPKNEKDKAIIYLLGGEYSPTETIKSLLYKMAIGGIQGVSLSFGGYVNTVNVNNSLDNNPIATTLKNETDSNTTVDNDILDFFN